MPVVSKDQAVALLIRGVEQTLPADEVLEVYNELFPQDRRTAAEVGHNIAPLVQRLVAYINADQPLEMIIELWNLILTPRYPYATYDEETEGLSYDEVAETRTGA